MGTGRRTTGPCPTTTGPPVEGGHLSRRPHRPATRAPGSPGRADTRLRRFARTWPSRPPRPAECRPARRGESRSLRRPLGTFRPPAACRPPRQRFRPPPRRSRPLRRGRSRPSHQRRPIRCRRRRRRRSRPRLRWACAVRRPHRSLREDLVPSRPGSALRRPPWPRLRPRPHRPWRRPRPPACRPVRRPRPPACRPVRRPRPRRRPAPEAPVPSLAGPVGLVPRPAEHRAVPSRPEPGPDPRVRDGRSDGNCRLCRRPRASACGTSQTCSSSCLNTSRGSSRSA
jgi:hypothetical protein